MMQVNVKKIILIIILGIHLYASEKDDDVPYIVYAKEIMGTFIKRSEKAYNLDCIGTGGRFAKNVAQINIQFLAYRKGTIEEARMLEVTLIETLLKAVNDHEKIRPFLSQYPFKAENLHISIGFRKEDDAYYLDNSIAHVSQVKNKIFYDVADPKTSHLLDFMEEPYEEALKIINKVK